MYYGLTSSVPEYDIVQVSLTEENFSNYFDITYGDDYSFDLSGGTFTSNNAGVLYSEALLTLKAKQDCDISFNYSVTSETDLCPLNIYLDDIIVVENFYDVNNSKSCNIKLLNGQSILISYQVNSRGADSSYATLSSFNLDASTIVGTVDKDVAKKVPKLYYGDDNNFAKKIIKAYYGDDNNIAKRFYDYYIPYVMFYTDRNMVFQFSEKTESGKTLRYKYEEMGSYQNSESTPWSSITNSIISVTFKENLPITSLAYYMMNATTLINVNYHNFNINNVTNMAYTYYNCSNLTGSPVCGSNVTNMAYTYNYCYSLTGSPVCSNNVTNMAHAYNFCNNLTGSPVCSNNVTNMYSTYHCCANLTGSPVCSNNVINMYSTYQSCYNLTGSPVCSNNVTNMAHTYASCYNITGSPVCGNNVTNMARAYASCYNITGSPVCGSNVTNMYNTYSNCNNLTGSPVFGNKVTDIGAAYENCTNLSAGNIYMYSNNISRASHCFAGKNNSRRYNIYAYQNTTTWNTLRKNFFSNSLVGDNIKWTNYSNGGFYNKKYNIYVLPI